MLLAAVIFNIYGFYEASEIEITRLKISNPDMAQNAAPIRIVQVSDLHYGLTMLNSRHQNILKQVQALNPDMIISTGDFLDRGSENSLEHMLAWQTLQPRLGKYAVTGNHEAIANLPRSLKLLKTAGFKVLRGELEDFSSFRLIGLDDPRTGESDKLNFIIDELKDRTGISILLHHRPGWPKKFNGLFDLVLSGHTHGGQIFPFAALVYFTHGNLSGLYPTEWGGASYVNRGTGTWGPPVRILSPPEITLFVMQHGETKQIGY
ncbi:MAG: metallophosphoesterase [Magnetococcales bacterium]|nr:metallophosphoesterase [Magnetococcales bacterium]